jgi:hypothetical protein
VNEDEDMSKEAKAAIGNYMDLLDVRSSNITPFRQYLVLQGSTIGSSGLVINADDQKIQFILRQTVYYLHETKASSNTLRPPHPNSIPTPFASTLPSSDTKASGQVELGLYGKRIEARTLKEMIEVLGRLEGVVPPDVRSSIRGNGNGLQGGDPHKEGTRTSEGVIDDMDMEDRTPKAEDVRS